MDKKTALELYTLFRQENSLWLGSHREHSQQYFTLVIAILGASIAAISKFVDLHPFLMVIVIIGPLINLQLCKIAITMCDRSYQVYLECISIQSKLEPIIGLTETREISSGEQPIPQFPKDEHILPARWLKSRHFASAEVFVKQGMDLGTNKIIRQTFTVLAFTNGLIAIGIAMYSILKFFGFI
jgi:hypothetical protein